jgi:hypothetical protein
MAAGNTTKSSTYCDYSQTAASAAPRPSARRPQGAGAEGRTRPRLGASAACTFHELCVEEQRRARSRRTGGSLRQKFKLSLVGPHRLIHNDTDGRILRIYGDCNYRAYSLRLPSYAGSCSQRPKESIVENPTCRTGRLTISKGDVYHYRSSGRERSK